MFANRKQFKKIFFVCLFYVIAITFAFAYLENEINVEELYLMKKNGIISGMCYVVELISSTIARAIMCIFIMATGWSYIKAMKVDWKTLIPITIATALVFGSEQIANEFSFSKSNYSCSALKKLNEPDDSYISNSGLCAIIDLPQANGKHEWSKCNSSEDNCTQKVTTNSSIVAGDIVALTKCAVGYYMDGEKILHYKCIANDPNGLSGEWKISDEMIKQLSNWNIAELKDEDSATKYFLNDKDAVDHSVCRRYCSIADLKTFFSHNVDYKPITKESKIIPINKLVVMNDDAKHSINEDYSIYLYPNTGSFVMENQGVSNGAELAITCSANNGYSEIIKITNQVEANSDVASAGEENRQSLYNIVENYISNNSEDDESKIRLKCDDTGKYQVINASCQKNCKFSSIKNYKYVDEWKVCIKKIKDKNKCKENDCELIDSCETMSTTELLKNVSVASQTILQVEACAGDYKIQHESQKIKYICDGGNWSTIPKNTMVVDGKNIFCEAGCNIEDIPNYEITNTITYDTKQKDPVTKEYEYLSIGDKKLFYTNEEVRIDACKNNATIMTHELREKQGNRLELATFKCETNGSWSLSNKNGQYCHKDCIVNDFQELFVENEKAKDLTLMNTNKKMVEEFRNDKLAGVYFTLGANINTNIYNGEYVKVSSCQTGYAIKNNSPISLFKCVEGDIKFNAGSRYICKKLCSRADIPSEFANVKSWGYCGNTTYSCDTYLDDSMVLYEGDNISARECKDGYTMNNSEETVMQYSVIKCNEYGEWDIVVSGGECVRK